MDNNKMVSGLEKKLPIKKISSIIAGVLVVFICFAVVSTVGYGVIYVKGFISGSGTANVGLVDIVYTTPSETMQAIILCVLTLVGMVLMILAYILLRRFFVDIAAKDKPFLPGQGKRLRIIAVLMITSAVLSAIESAWALTLTAGPTDGVALVWTFFFTLVIGIIFPLILFSLAFIFNRGMSLQTESDETL